MKILAIESSCDETAAAVVENGTIVLSSIVASSSDFHKQYGGILPELAARKQLDFILPVITQALHIQSIDALAVTIGPGLIGSLLVGVEAAKTIAFVTNKPIIPVNHVHAHIYANIATRDPLNQSEASKRHEILFPAIALVVSGGHTELFIMENERNIRWLSGTIDDAAGEAFDKTARLLGFENQGGQAIEQAAKKNKLSALSFPRPLIHDNTLNFSFSGLKTAVSREWNKQTLNLQPSTLNPQLVNAFAYEIQEAITDVLVARTIKAAIQHNAVSILLSGGVASNIRLREKCASRLKTQNNPYIKLYYPPKELCTDNAVVVASAAFFLGKPISWRDITTLPNLPVNQVF